MDSKKKKQINPIKNKEMKSAVSENRFQSVDDSFPIVGIGASAGGLEALVIANAKKMHQQKVHH